MQAFVRFEQIGTLSCYAAYTGVWYDILGMQILWSHPKDLPIKPDASLEKGKDTQEDLGPSR